MYGPLKLSLVGPQIELSYSWRMGDERAGPVNACAQEAQEPTNSHRKAGTAGPTVSAKRTRALMLACPRGIEGPESPPESLAEAFRSHFQSLGWSHLQSHFWSHLQTYSWRHFVESLLDSLLESILAWPDKASCVASRDGWALRPAS